MMGGTYGGAAGSADYDGSRDIFSFDYALINNDQDSLLENPPWRKEDTQLLAKSRDAIVDDIMFTFFKGDVLAYDFATENWFERPVEVLSIPPTQEGHMIHI
ncbi:hypothetical protein IFM89_018706, partial [Coptis chinensis]